MTALALLFYLLQCTLFKTLSLASISPNLLIILTFAFGFMGGKRNGMYVGFICGFLMDVFYGDVLGFNTLIFVYVGYVKEVFLLLENNSLR